MREQEKGKKKNLIWIRVQDNIGQNKIKYLNSIKWHKRSYNWHKHVIVIFRSILIKNILFQTCFKHSQGFAIFEGGVHFVPDNWSPSCDSIFCQFCILYFTASFVYVWRFSIQRSEIANIGLIHWDRDFHAHHPRFTHCSCFLMGHLLTTLGYNSKDCS